MKALTWSPTPSLCFLVGHVILCLYICHRLPGPPPRNLCHTLSSLGTSRAMRVRTFFAPQVPCQQIQPHGHKDLRHACPPPDFPSVPRTHRAPFIPVNVTKLHRLCRAYLPGLSRNVSHWQHPPCFLAFSLPSAAFPHPQHHFLSSGHCHPTGTIAF